MKKCITYIKTCNQCPHCRSHTGYDDLQCSKLHASLGYCDEPKIPRNCPLAELTEEEAFLEKL